MTCFVELVWRNYKKRRRVVVHGLLPVYFQHLLDHFKVLSHGVLSHFSALSDGRVIRFVGMELHILLDLPYFIQRVADDALHKLLEDLFAVVQPDLVASYTLHLLVQCFFLLSVQRLLPDSLVASIQMETVRWGLSSCIYHFLLN